MRTLIIAVLAVFSISASAQKIRFTDSRNRWTTQGVTFDCPTFHSTYSYDLNDTIINSNTYNRIAVTTVWDPSCMIVTSVGHYYVREDTLTNKVYYLGGASSSADSSEYVLYDYNLVVGDTITTAMGGTSITDTVVNIDSTSILGVWHKRWTLHGNTEPISGFTRRAYVVVEGVGSTNGPLFSSFFIGCFEYFEQLKCFSQSGAYPAFVASRQGCIGSAGTDSIDNAGDCIALSERITRPLNARYAITPNPASDYINVISTTVFGDNTRVSVYDITGKCISKTHADGFKNAQTINTSSWSNGLYMVIIQDNTGILKKEKVQVLR